MLVLLILPNKMKNVGDERDGNTDTKAAKRGTTRPSSQAGPERTKKRIRASRASRSNGKRTFRANEMPLSMSAPGLPGLPS